MSKHSLMVELCTSERIYPRFV